MFTINFFSIHYFSVKTPGPQDVSLVSQKEVFYHVKVQIVKEINIFIHLKIYLKRVSKIKENAYLAMLNPKASRALRQALDPNLYKLISFM